MPPIFPKTNLAIAFGDPEDSDILTKTLLCKFCRGPREVSDFPREFVTKSDAKLRQKNEKSTLISKKRRKILTVSCKKNAEKMQKMTFFHNVSNKGSFNICIFEKFFVPL